jgi:hypothetical protein
MSRQQMLDFLKIPANSGIRTMLQARCSIVAMPGYQVSSPNEIINDLNKTAPNNTWDASGQWTIAHVQEFIDEFILKK